MQWNSIQTYLKQLWTIKNNKKQHNNETTQLKTFKKVEGIKSMTNNLQWLETTWESTNLWESTKNK